MNPGVLFFEMAFWVRFYSNFAIICPIIDLKLGRGCIKVFNGWGSIQEWGSNNMDTVFVIKDIFSYKQVQNKKVLLIYDCTLKNLNNSWS